MNRCWAVFDIRLPPLETLVSPEMLAAIGLLGILSLLLSRTDRWLLNLSLVFLALYVLVLLVQAQLPEGARGQRFLGPAAAFLITACIGRTAALLVMQFLIRRLQLHLPKIFLDIAMGLVYGAALLALLEAAGVPPTNVLAGSALVTAIIALALKDTLGHIFAGLAIQAQQPFEVGDWIQYEERGQVVGQVVEINWRATTLITSEGVEVIIPNSRLADNLLRNYSRPEPWSRRAVSVVCPLDVPPGRVQEILMQAVLQQPDVLKQPPPSVLANNFTERGIEYLARYFIADFGDRDRIDSAVRNHIWYALNRHGIALAVGQQRVLLREDSQAVKEKQEELRLAQRREYLHQVDVFAGLPEETLTHLARLAQTRLYATGEVIVRQGDVGDELFIIHNGEVSVAVQDERGCEVELRHIGPGQFFGEMSLLTGAPRSATVRAIRDCELVVIAKPTFATLLADTPSLIEPIRQTLTRRQQEQAEKRVSSFRADQKQPPHAENLVERFLHFFKLDR